MTQLLTSKYIAVAGVGSLGYEKGFYEEAQL
jgi:hypothetical protein